MTRSRPHVTRHSFGTGPLGNQFEALSDERATATIDAAWEVGIRAFDTAPHYGAGVAERRLGAALAGRDRDAFVVSTKVGRRLVPRRPGHAKQPAPFVEDPQIDRRWDFSRDGVLRSLEESLARLGLDAVDIVYLHDPDDHWIAAISEAYPTLHDLRADGVVGSIGAAMTQAPMLARFVQRTDMDRILLAGRYTLLEQSQSLALLDLCARRGVPVVAGGVLNSGILADPRPGAMYDYKPAAADLLRRAQNLEQVCRRFNVPLLAAALHFPLGHPAVESVVVGACSPAEVRRNAELLREPLPLELWHALQTEGWLSNDVPVPDCRRSTLARKGE
jgi:D-threo-aldose 1-dehydrogenase